MRQFYNILYILSFLILCNCNNVKDNSCKNIYSFKEDTSVSDINGIPKNKYISHFPFDSVKYVEFMVRVRKPNGIGAWFEKDYLEQYVKAEPTVDLKQFVDTILPVYYYHGKKSFNENLFHEFGEIILYNYYLKKEIYRFTLYRTFDSPLTIRIEKDEKNIFIYSRMTNGVSGYFPGKLCFNERKEINRKEWELFKNKIDEISFWNLPENISKSSGLDGAEYLLEGHSKIGYKRVIRWSPEKDNNFRKCCELLISLSDFKIDTLKLDKY